MKTIDKLSEVKDKLLDPRELSYRLNNRMRRQIEAVLRQDGLDVDLKDELGQLVAREDENKQLLDYDSLSEMHKLLQRLDPSYSHFFYQLLDECKAIAPKGKENVELEARLRQLKSDASNRAYGEMTTSVKPSTKGLLSVSDMKKDVQEIKPTLIALLNSVLVIGGTFLFVYKAVEYSSNEPNLAVQILAGLIASSIVAIAELYFFIKIL